MFYLSEYGARVSVKCLHLENVIVMIETGVAEHPVWFPVSENKAFTVCPADQLRSPVVPCRVCHGEESEELAECRLLVISVDILDNDAPPEDLVPEGREESVYGMSGNHEAFHFPLFVLQTVNIFLLCKSAHIFLLNLLHLGMIMS